MKKMKKLAASLLALVLAATMAAPAFAAGETYTLAKSSDNTNSYVAYQVFSAEFNEDGTYKPATINWADGYNGAGLITALQNTGFKKTGETAVSSPFGNATSAQDVAMIIYNNFMPGGDYASEANETLLADAIRDNVGSSSREYKIGEPVPYGYYVLVETSTDTSTTPATETNKNRLMTVNQFAQPITAKLGKSGVTKQVQRADGTTWSDGAVYQTGEAIPFNLTVTLPSDLRTQGTYNMVLHDIMDPGLDPTTIDWDHLTVTLVNGQNRTPVSAGDGNATTYKLNRTCTANPGKTGCAFEIVINNLQQNQNAANNGLVVVEYTAKLRDNMQGVNLNFVGNTNTVELYVNGELQGISKVNVFDLELNINKVNGNDQPLSGAKFALYKGDKPKGTVVNGVFTPAEDNTAELVYEFAADGAKHTLKDVKEGTYWLVETTTPEDYNTWEMKEITISTELKEGVGEELPGVLTNITVNGVDFVKGTTTDTSNSLTATIQNLQGLKLPATGGMGTTLFYIGGAVLVIGAVVLLITKRRVGDVDDD